MILPRSLKCLVYISKMHTLRGGRRGHDRMVVEFKITYAISAYHH
jgi:hypothetical protein